MIGKSSSFPRARPYRTFRDSVKEIIDVQVHWQGGQNRASHALEVPRNLTGQAGLHSSGLTHGPVIWLRQNILDDLAMNIG